MALFAYEVGDLLSERTLELSLLSALSVVGHDGAHPNAAEQHATGGSGADGGDGCSTPGGPPSAVSLSGDEDFIRSRLIQMYLPEYKMEVPGSHGPMFNRNSFSAATATANQMRASMDRKRAAGLSLSLFGDGGPSGAKRGSSGTGPTRRSDLALSNSRMSLAVRAAATRSFGCAGMTLQWNGWSAGGGSDAGLRRMSAHERLMAPWRRSIRVQSAAESLGPGDGDDDDDISDADVTDTCAGAGKRLADTGPDEGPRGEDAEAAGAGAGVGMARPSRGASGQRATQLPEPFVEFASVYEELRAAAEDSLRVNVGDPQVRVWRRACIAGSRTRRYMDANLFVPARTRLHVAAYVDAIRSCGCKEDWGIIGHVRPCLVASDILLAKRWPGHSAAHFCCRYQSASTL
ncbi:hypothetical protein Vretimale_19613 [Volvox reticuliferus]|nr:hypothetical protein Vretimale_19613 [Volvox reticuliferus]